MYIYNVYYMYVYIYIIFNHIYIYNLSIWHMIPPYKWHCRFEWCYDFGEPWIMEPFGVSRSSQTRSWFEATLLRRMLLTKHVDMLFCPHLILCVYFQALYDKCERASILDKKLLLRYMHTTHQYVLIITYVFIYLFINLFIHTLFTPNTTNTTPRNASNYGIDI